MENDKVTDVLDLYLGIDPGKTGAVALIDSVGKVLELYDCPVGESEMSKVVKQILKKYPKEEYTIFGALERVGAIPAMGKVCSVCKQRKGTSSSANFTFGQNHGAWRGILSYAEIPFHEPTPKMWQKGLTIKRDGGNKKQGKFAVASKIFPTAELSGPRGGIKDGRCDALLIADWRRRQ